MNEIHKHDIWFAALPQAAPGNRVISGPRPVVVVSADETNQTSPVVTAVQAFLGTLLGGLLALIFVGKTAFRLEYLALVFGCFLLGGGVAVWQLAKANVFTVMTGE